MTKDIQKRCKEAGLPEIGTESHPGPEREGLLRGAIKGRLKAPQVADTTLSRTMEAQAVSLKRLGHLSIQNPLSSDIATLTELIEMIDTENIPAMIETIAIATKETIVKIVTTTAVTTAMKETAVMIEDHHIVVETITIIVITITQDLTIGAIKVEILILITFVEQIEIMIMIAEDPETLITIIELLLIIKKAEFLPIMEELPSSSPRASASSTTGLATATAAADLLMIATKFKVHPMRGTKASPSSPKEEAEAELETDLI
jgi:hypothetical protein